jgi:hypothetical protein
VVLNHGNLSCILVRLPCRYLCRLRFLDHHRRISIVSNSGPFQTRFRNGILL